MYKLLLVLAMLRGMPLAVAGPSEGDLFGYRLGSKYPVTDSTKGYFWPFMGSMVVVADKPEKSDDFKKVELIATPKTFTIANIYGVAEVATEKEAKAMAARYSDLLQTLHAAKCHSEKAYLGEALKLLCGGQYELTVSHYPPDKNEKNYKVHVGLKFSNDAEGGKRILTQGHLEKLPLWAAVR